MKFYRREPDAALAGMAELTMAERGAYNTLIDLLWARDGLVPDDDRLVARMMTCDVRQWKYLKQRLMIYGKVRSIDGLLISNGFDQRLADHLTRSEVAAKSARARWRARRKNKGSPPACGKLGSIDRLTVETVRDRAEIEPMSRRCPADLSEKINEINGRPMLYNSIKKERKNIIKGREKIACGKAVTTEPKKRSAENGADKDRSQRPTYQELVAKHGPNWGLKEN